MVQLDEYRKEIFNFLRTVSIKFEPFAYLMGSSYMQQYGLEDPHGEWNPYYINLSGNYAPSDTRMTVYASEVGRHVPFDRDLIKNYPRTAALYKIPNPEYTILEERYPNNLGLIRSIAYPINDIKDAIAAPNFALLSYDDSLLHINERENLVATLKTFLDMVKARWWIVEYTYENMYAVTFWAMLWQCLPNILLTQRFKNIKTPYVHPFHIWEYLKSKGLKDYRDVLTNNQANWLYRNIDYILKNKGKHTNLIDLAENLLEEIFVSLVTKDIVQETGSKWDDCVTNPIFVSKNIVTGEEVSKETVKNVNDKLVGSGLDSDTSAERVEELEKELGEHPFNELPTKVVELKKDSINTSNELTMVKFFLDTLMYRVSQNDCSFYCSLLEPVNNINIKLYVGDMIALWYWALKKSIGEEPTYLPTKYRAHIPFIRQQPKETDIPASIYYDGFEYRTNQLIDIPGILKKITWFNQPFTKDTEFVSVLVAQYKTYLYLLRCMEQSNLYLYHKAMDVMFESIMENDWLDIKLHSAEHYVDWIYSNEWISTLIDSYESSSNKEQLYASLAEKCYDSLFPLESVVSEDFIGTSRNMETIYKSVRDLFISLGSYNIVYLETERDSNTYLKIKDPDFITPTKLIYHMNNFWNHTVLNPKIEQRIVNRFSMEKLYLNTIMEEIKLHAISKHELPVDIVLKDVNTHAFKNVIKLRNDFVQKKYVQKIDFKLNVNNEVTTWLNQQ